MVLNNEHFYNTSEKSARFTTMQNLEPLHSDLYNKYLPIFKKEIDKKYEHLYKLAPFFNKNKTLKLAQENARLLAPITTSTKMNYTTSFRQLNYLCNWLKLESQNPTNYFYKLIQNDMAEFVEKIENLNLILPGLIDGKNKKLSLFGRGILKENFSNTYQTVYKMSFEEKNI